MSKPITLNAGNGWIVSIAHDINGSYSVAGYLKGNDMKARPVEWFKFRDGKDDQRIYGLDGLLKAIEEIRTASDPNNPTVTETKSVDSYIDQRSCPMEWSTSLDDAADQDPV